jgi:hypothetical protein
MCVLHVQDVLLNILHVFDNERCVRMWSELKSQSEYMIMLDLPTAHSERSGAPLRSHQGLSGQSDPNSFAFIINTCVIMEDERECKLHASSEGAPVGQTVL